MRLGHLRWPQPPAHRESISQRALATLGQHALREPSEFAILVMESREQLRCGTQVASAVPDNRARENVKDVSDVQAILRSEASAALIEVNANRGKVLQPLLNCQPPGSLPVDHMPTLSDDYPEAMTDLHQEGCERP